MTQIGLGGFVIFSTFREMLVSPSLSMLSFIRCMITLHVFHFGEFIKVSAGWACSAIKAKAI